MKGLLIKAVARGSTAAALGLRAGDRLLAIDDLVPRDLIDLQLELPDARCLVSERPDGKQVMLQPPSRVDPASLTLDEAIPGGIRECNNHCEFCFIRGLPGGLRPTLYVFDDDYRYSFLWGNFLTLTNLDEADWARIGYQRLSPLNVSVHASHDDVRRALLVNRHAPPILEQLRRLAGLGIEVNTQVVLCSGINDGAVLERSIADLAQLYPAVRSVSVVPVGLTRYSRVKNIRRPTPVEARTALEQCERWQARLRGELGVGFVYASDELYVLAGRDDVPPAAAYDGYPALANGVGLLRSMLDEWQALTWKRSVISEARRRDMWWLTGRLAAPALQRIAKQWHACTGWLPTVHIVENAFFGNEISASGLLSGADLIDALHEVPQAVDDIVLPRGAFGFDGRETLDGISAEAVGAAHPGRVHLTASASELFEILMD